MYRSDATLAGPQDLAGARALRGETVVNEEYLVQREDGEKASFLCSAAPIRDASGAVTGALVSYRDITRRKITEEKLRVSEELYRATFDHAAIGIAHVGLDGRWIRFNDAVSAITGYPRAQLVEKTFADITHPDDLAADWALAHRVSAGEIPRYSMEKRYLRPDGSPVWVNLTVSMVRDAMGAPQHYIAIIEDIDARKKVEAALSETDRYLQSVLDSIADSVMVVDAQSKYTYVNRAWQRMSGMRREDVIGKNRYEIFPETRGSNLEAEFQRAVRDRVPVEFETYYAPWQRWIAIRAYPREDGGLISYSHDVTAEKSAVKALAQSEERYRSLVLATSAFIWTADANGQFTSPQPGWAAYTGQTFEEYEGSRWASAVHPEDRERVAEAWRAAVASKSIYEVEWRAWHGASRTWRHCHSRGVPIVGDHGEVREWIAAVTDVHERKLLEAQLQHDDKVDSLGVLAGGVAHDFNNLLVGILGNASLAQDAASPAVRGYLERIESAAQRAAALTRQMLAYAGKQQFVFAQLDISSEIREVLALVRSSLHPSIHLELDLDAHLPPVKADQGQIQQVVMNLLINAGEAVSAEGGRIRVTTSADAAGRSVSLCVEDNGCGMTPEVKARIFDPFFTTKFMGRGLGLAAVMGIVRAHLGAIEVESVPGSGTVFRVRFPAAQEDEAPSPANLERCVEAVEPATVLLIDDEEMVRKFAEHVLNRMGAQVLTADCGRAGIDVFRARAAEIDLVVLDASMPDLGGREVLREIRKLRPDMPILTSSGHPRSEMERYFGEDRSLGFLSKPYKPDELAAAVAALIGDRSIRRAV
jgi:PAS domain S-box-containing protein